jgi:FkbM family methyltransferase
VRAVPTPRRLWRAARYRRIMRAMAGSHLLRAFAAEQPSAFFVEIGSNDGDQHDHLAPIIRSRPWRGIMVEPVPYVFERLRRNYAGMPGIALENVAIADRDGELEFFHLAEATPQERKRLPRWYDAIGSFSREAVLGHAQQIPDIERRITSTRVPCLTFATLCARHAVGELDLLVVDTEGHDAQILATVDLAAWHPRIVVYEHFHLAADVRAACAERLRGAGYETMEEGFDTWCLTPRDDELTRIWRDLRPTVAGVSAGQERA